MTAVDTELNLDVDLAKEIPCEGSDCVPLAAEWVEVHTCCGKSKVKCTLCKVGTDQYIKENSGLVKCSWCDTTFTPTVLRWVKL
jgi:hypothetical protein